MAENSFAHGGRAASRITPEEQSSNPAGDAQRLAQRLSVPGRDSASAQSFEPEPRPFPVESWNPPFCGDIDMRIARDGSWHYQGSRIERFALVKLFSRILRKDPERYVLVTPVERVGVIVEDAPFLAVELDVGRRDGEQVLVFRTNVGDSVEADAEHPLRFEKAEAEGLKPYVLVRGGLWALATRAVALEIVGLGEVRTSGGVQLFGVASAGVFFPMADAAEIEPRESEGANADRAGR